MNHQHNIPHFDTASHPRRPVLQLHLTWNACQGVNKTPALTFSTVVNNFLQL